MRRAIRALLARPGFSAVAVVTLALGLGANAAIFSLTRTVLLRPLPYRDADRLVQVGEASPARAESYSGVVPANYVEWRERVTAFEDTAAWRFMYFTISGHGDRPLRAMGVLGEPAFFPLLGIAPQPGRQFAPDEGRAGRNNVVLLGRGFWRREFGADPAAVGRTLVVDGTPCTIVGVLPESFKFFHVLNRELDVWRPFMVDPADREHSVTVYARLRPGASLESARAELAAALAALPAEPFRDGWTATAELLSARFTANQRPILRALEIAVALVMCIAAANISNLLLAAAAGRRKDVAVRVALGATRWQLATELGRETLLLGAAGAAVGLTLAVWIVDVLNTSISYQDINRLEPFRVDLFVVAFTLALAGLSATIFALLPARRVASADVVNPLKDSSPGSTTGVGNRRLRAALVVGELALSIVLLTSALQLTGRALSLNAMDRGVDVDRVMTAQLALNAPHYADATRLTQFADAVLARLTAADEIVSASLVNYPPLSAIGTSFPIAVEGRADVPGREPRALCWIVAPRYFETVGIPLLAGRDFAPGDTRDRLGVAVVTQRLAQRFWGRPDVLGERLTVLFPQSDAFWIPRAIRRQLTIVGVVGEVREDGIGEPGAADPQMYVPYSQSPTRILTIVARVHGQPAAAAPLVREAVRAVDPDQPTFDERTLDDVRNDTFARSREIAWLIGAFAALALALSAIGVYGVVAYLTAARRREIGIRMALGATRRDVVGMVLGDTLKLTTMGLAIGCIATPIASRLASASVVGLSAWNPLALAAVAAALAGVCVAAAAIPAYRAARGGLELSTTICHGSTS